MTAEGAWGGGGVRCITVCMFMGILALCTLSLQQKESTAIGQLA